MGGKSSNMSLKMQERSISRSIFFDGILSLSILQGANEATCGVKPGAEMSRDEFEQSSVLSVVLQGTRHVTYSHRLLSHVGYCCSEGLLRRFQFLPRRSEALLSGEVRAGEALPRVPSGPGSSRAPRLLLQGSRGSVNQCVGGGGVQAWEGQQVGCSSRTSSVTPSPTPSTPAGRP